MEQTKTTPPQQTAPVAEVLAPADPAQRPARLALYLGSVLIVAGIVALYIGYNGTATNPYEAAQIPYVVSGGLGGIAMLALGGISLAVYVLLRVQADLRQELTDLRGSIQALNDGVSRQAYSSLNGNGASTNGFVMVAEGSSTFHKPDCRLVARASGARPLPRAEAESAGSIACRICKP